MLPPSVVGFLAQGGDFLSAVFANPRLSEACDKQAASCESPAKQAPHFPYWHQLPRGVQDLVLGFVDAPTLQTCLCVNRDFNDRSRALGRSLRPTSLPQDGLAIFPSVEEVDFSRVPNVTDNALASFLMAASGKNPAARIKSLTLKRAKALGSLSFDMLSRMRTLTSLNLALCYGLDDDGLVLLGSQLPHLYTLNVRRCHKVTDLGIQALAPRARGLTNLNISCCSQRMGDVAAQAIATHLTKLVKLKADGMPMLTDDGVEVLAKGLNRLQLLSVDRLQRRFPHYTKLTERSLTVIADGMPRLQHLRMSLQNCKDDPAAGFPNPGLAMISTHLKFLRRLELYRAARLGDASIAAVASIPGLSHLVLHEAGNVTDRGIQQLMAGMAEKVDEGESLRFLELNRCPLLSRNAIASLAQLRKLQVLRLVALPQDAFWGISALAATAVPLRFLDIKGNVEMQDAVPCILDPSLLRYIGKLRTLHGLGLRYLDLSAIHNFANLAPLTRLKVLSLAGSDKLHCRATSVLTPNVLEGLGENLKITHLDLSLCTSLRNVGLAGAAPHLPRLQSLHLGMCMSCTQQGILAIAATLPELRYLNISAVGGWKGVSESTATATTSTSFDLPPSLRVDYGLPLPWRAKVLTAVSLANVD